MWNLLLIYSGLLGLVIGSFLNALIWRLHSGESMLDRSRCPNCHKAIAWYDNVPVLSYLMLRGKCRKCSTGISIQYPLVELVVAVLFILALNHEFRIMNQDALSMVIDSKFLIQVLKAWFIIAVMVIVFVYDLRWYMILDKVTMPASLVLFVLWIIQNWQSGALLHNRNGWLGLLISVAIGFGFFGLQYLVSKGRWIGGGDVKLGVVMGLALAWPSQVIGAIFLAYILGSLFGLVLIGLGKKELGSKLPFGTFLSVATIVIMLWGEGIINWYGHLLGL